MSEQPKRHLRNYLLDRRMQLHYALWVTLISAVVAVTLGAVIYRQSAFASEQIVQGLDAPEMAWLDAPLREQIEAGLRRSDLDLVLWMAGVGLVLALTLMGALVVMTHKVAGPLYRMAAILEQLRQGRLTPPGALRKGDQLGSSFEALRTAHAALRRRAEEDLAAIDELLRACAAQGVHPSPELAAALRELESLRDEKMKSL